MGGDGRNKYAMIKIVRFELEAKGGAFVCRFDPECGGQCVAEWVKETLERGDSDSREFTGEAFTETDALHVLDVGRNRCDGKIIEAFIKSGMFCDFDAL